jgi:hypothetical protein
MRCVLYQGHIPGDDRRRGGKYGSGVTDLMYCHPPIVLE